MDTKKQLYKALLIPINSKREILIQDRRGFKAPEWGFFGGSIENGEEPIEAVIRETKEELSIVVAKDDLVYLGEFYTDYKDEQIWRHIYIYRTNQNTFNVQEGRGGSWVTYNEAKKLLLDEEHFDELSNVIDKVLA